MKKNTIIFMLLLFSLSAVVIIFIRNKRHSTSINDIVQSSRLDRVASNIKAQSNTIDSTIFTLNGVSLGMMKGAVLNILGNNYTERKEYEEMWSCTLKVIEYKNELVVTFWNSTVIEVEALSSAITTNLGCKIGDTYSSIRKKHDKLYKPYFTDYLNPPRNIPGWYANKTTILIFDFDKSDGAIYNKDDIEDGRRVERIVLLFEGNLN